MLDLVIITIQNVDGTPHTKNVSQDVIAADNGANKTHGDLNYHIALTKNPLKWTKKLKKTQKSILLKLKTKKI